MLEVVGEFGRVRRRGGIVRWVQVGHAASMTALVRAVVAGVARAGEVQPSA